LTSDRTNEPGEPITARTSSKVESTVLSGEGGKGGRNGDKGGAGNKSCGSCSGGGCPKSCCCCSCSNCRRFCSIRSLLILSSTSILACSRCFLMLRAVLGDTFSSSLLASSTSVATARPEEAGFTPYTLPQSSHLHDSRQHSAAYTVRNSQTKVQYLSLLVSLLLFSPFSLSLLLSLSSLSISLSLSRYLSGSLARSHCHCFLLVSLPLATLRVCALIAAVCCDILCECYLKTLAVIFGTLRSFTLTPFASNWRPKRMLVAEM